MLRRFLDELFSDRNLRRPCQTRRIQNTSSSAACVERLESRALLSASAVTAQVSHPHVNHAPIGTPTTVTTPENKPYQFKISDFGFTDPKDVPPNIFTAVKITTVPGAGRLTDNGRPVSVGQFVSVADIKSGNLVFAPPNNATGSAYARFTFQVRDSGSTAQGGVNLDPTPKTMTVNVATRVFPYVVSINGSNPGGLTTSAGTLHYTVKFSEPVTGVTADDFSLVTTGLTKVMCTTPIAVTAVSGSVYTVTISHVAGAGSIQLNLMDNGSIRDLTGNPLAAKNGSVKFQNQLTFATGQRPSEVVAADLNRDGKLDLVVANTNANTVSVLLGNGNGTFQNQMTFATGSAPWSMSVGDVNGDGIPDIITTNAGDNTVGVLFGKGNGTFRNQIAFAVGDHPLGAPVVADVNNDGKADLIVTNYNANTVSVLLGNGNGTFKNQMQFNTGLAPRQPVVADVNRDGIPDLVIANSKGMSVSVLLGNGNGTFKNQMQFTAGSSVGNTKFLSVADLNGDGKPDIVVTDGNARSLSVLIGNGNGTFRSQVKYATGDTPQAVEVADVNGDGIPDIVVGNWGPTSNNVGVLLGKGNGTFQNQVTLSTGLAPHSVVIADVNRDGRPDLIVSNEHSNTTSVLLGAKNGSFNGQTYHIKATAHA